MSSAKIRAVGIIIYRQFDASSLPYLLLLETSYNKEWAPPKGHVDPGESDLTTAYRETEEEAGIQSSDILLCDDFQDEIHYHVKNSPYYHDVTKEKTTVYFLGKVHFDQKVTLSDEHTGYKWVTFAEAIETAMFENYKKVYSSAKQFIENITNE